MNFRSNNFEEILLNSLLPDLELKQLNKSDIFENFPSHQNIIDFGHNKSVNNILDKNQKRKIKSLLSYFKYHLNNNKKNDRSDKYRYGSLLKNLLSNETKIKLKKIMKRHPNKQLLGEKYFQNQKNVKIFLKEKSFYEFYLQNNFNIKFISKSFKIPYLRALYLIKINKNKSDFINSIKKEKTFNISESDLKLFKTNLKFYQDNHFTVDQMRNHFLISIKKYSKMSISTFKRLILKRLKITYKKIIYKTKPRQEEFYSNKIYFYLNVYECFLKNEFPIMFFDETIMIYNQRKQYGWNYSAQKNIKMISRKNIFIHLMMLIDQNKVVYFRLFDRSTKGKDVEQFLCMYFKTQVNEHGNEFQPSVIVLDNSSKNRTKAIKELVNKNNFGILYTIPTSPFLNMIESIFNILKQKIYKQNFNNK